MIIFFIFGAVILLMLASVVNHRYMLKKEDALYRPSGNMFEVNNGKIHVYSTGSGKTTLVFLSGHGTSCPFLDFKPLWIKLQDEYRVVVVERPGYGFSETTDEPRDLDNILSQTRQALKSSGENGPYVIIPHSMSGLEAIYWAVKYPGEVKAIIGIDPCTPDSVELLPLPNKILLLFMKFISFTGLVRFMGEKETKNKLPVLKSDELTMYDKNIYLSVFYKNTFSKNMLEEVRCLKQNARKLKDFDVPVETPMFFYVSLIQDKRIPGWKEALEDYLANLKIGGFKELDTDHYIHYEKADIIADGIREFLLRIDK